MLEWFSYEWETFTVTILYGYDRNFECFERDYDTAMVMIRRGMLPTHVKTTLMHLSMSLPQWGECRHGRAIENTMLPMTGEARHLLTQDSQGFIQVLANHYQILP